MFQGEIWRFNINAHYFLNLKYKETIIILPLGFQEYLLFFFIYPVLAN
jgi:hypothetical protein